MGGEGSVSWGLEVGVEVEVGGGGRTGCEGEREEDEGVEEIAHFEGWWV